MKNAMLASRKPWITRYGTKLVALVAVIAYAGFVQWIWGWGTMLALWREVGLTSAAAALLLLLSTYVMRTWRIRDYFRAETRGRFAPLLRVVQIHNLLNVMLPFRSGEVSFPLLMKQEFGVSFTRASAALLVMRLLDLHALLAAGGAGLALQAGTAIGWLLWALFCLLPAAGFLLRRSLFAILRARLPLRLEHVVDEIESGLPLSTSAFARAWAVTLANWFVKIAVLAWVLVLLGALDLAPAFGGALAGELSSVLPFHAPGGVGTYPAGISAGAVAFGADRSGPGLAALGKAAVDAHLLIIVSSILGALLVLPLPGARPAPQAAAGEP